MLRTFLFYTEHIHQHFGWRWWCAFVNFFNKMNQIQWDYFLLLIHLAECQVKATAQNVYKKYCIVWSTLKTLRIKWIKRRNNLIYSVCMQILLKWFYCCVCGCGIGKCGCRLCYFTIALRVIQLLWFHFTYNVSRASPSSFSSHFHFIALFTFVPFTLCVCVFLFN